MIRKRRVLFSGCRSPILIVVRLNKHFVVNVQKKSGLLSITKKIKEKIAIDFAINYINELSH